MADFWSYVDKRINYPCWIWIGGTGTNGRGTPYGYGVDPKTGKTDLAHRIAYRLSGKKIPKGRHLHHKCENTLCVRPLHLEPLTPKAHNLKGDSVTAVNARKTICKRGHALKGKNLRVTVKGYRECIPCVRLLVKKWRLAKKGIVFDVDEAAKKVDRERGRSN